MQVSANFSLSQWLGTTKKILFVESSAASRTVSNSTGISVASEQLDSLGKVTLAELGTQLKNVAAVVDSNPFRLAEFSKANPSIVRIFFDKYHRYFEATSSDRSPLTLACLANAHGVFVVHPTMSLPGVIDTIFAEAVTRCNARISLHDLLLENSGGGIKGLCSLYKLSGTEFDESHPCPPDSYSMPPNPDWIALSKRSKK